jgi:OmpA-OmpF porin, OOP family
MSINRKTALAALLGSALTAGTAYAAEPGFYVGASGGQTTLKVDDFDIDESDTAWKGFVGYNFAKWIGFEAAYVDLGGASDSGANVDLDVTAWEGFVVGMLPMGPVDLFVKAGGASIEAELDAPSFTEDASDEYFAYGAGLAYNFGHWAIRAEYEAYDVDDIDDLYVVSGGLTYRFGGDKPKPTPVAAAKPAPAPAPKPAPAAPAKCADSDGDGVCDTADQCPGTPAGARVGPGGCDCDYTLALEFTLNSAELHADDYAKLDAILPVLKNPKVAFIGGEVNGYADSTGTEEYNIDLSKRRAQAVADYYKSKGVNLADRFVVNGYGEANPVASNDTKEGRAQNRRVVLRRTDCGPAN